MRSGYPRNYAHNIHPHLTLELSFPRSEFRGALHGAKGLTRSQAIRKHALRTSIIPVATSVAFSVPDIFTGAIMMLTIFAW